MLKPKKDKICKVCKDTFKPFNSFQRTCCVDCAIKDGQNRSEVSKKKEKNKARGELNNKDKTWLKKQARFHCHKYIRERDKELPCISCGTFYNKLNYQQAGHFKSDGNHSNIRYHKDNIHGQCVRCNMHKSGEGQAFEESLRKRIGDKRVDDLLFIAKEVKDYSLEELRGIAEDYKKRYKEITKELDI